MDPNAQPFIPPQPLNPNAQPFIPQPQPQPQPLNPNAQPFIPQAQPQLNPNAQPFIPQQQPPLNPQPLNPNAPPFYPPYPNIPDNTLVNPMVLNMIINLPPSQLPYQIVREWHLVFEVWAYQDGLNGGYVSHFNIQAAGGPQLHVYYNALGQLEVVGIGQRPTGY